MNEKYLHFVGVGGAGMNPLAKMALEAGYRVTGSDRLESENLQYLREQGAQTWSTHSAERLADIYSVDVLPLACVVSTAIYPDNPEIAWCSDHEVSVIHRSDLLQRFASEHEREIVIAGTHGKTTTTSLLVWLCMQLDLRASWLIGGQPLPPLVAGHYDIAREIIVYEGDESDQSFLKSSPYLGILTSVEPDHLENYQGSFAVQKEKFYDFAQRCQYLIACIDDPVVVEIVERLREESADVQVIPYCREQLDSSECTELLGFASLPGQHNKLNALAAIKAFLQITDGRYSIDNIADIFQSFPGIGRRFEQISVPPHPETGCQYPVTIIDDYAHHPTEMKAAISAARGLLGQQIYPGRLIVAFQPHLPARLRDLWDGFVEVLSDERQIDMLFLGDLYLARGSHIDGIDTAMLSRDIVHRELYYCPGQDLLDLTEKLASYTEAHDIVLILGAGDITNIREPLAHKLCLKE